MAAVSVIARYTATITATTTRPDAIARPAPITDDPRYSGCATNRYGPDRVTSRDLLR